MGCDLIVLLNRDTIEIDTTQFVRCLMHTSYSRSLQFPNAPKWSIRNEKGAEFEIIAADKRCEINVGTKVVVVSTDLGVLEFVSDREEQSRIVELVDGAAKYLGSTWAVFLPDDVEPFQDMRESVMQQGMSVGALALLIAQLGRRASTPSGMGEFNMENGSYFACTKAFTKEYVGVTDSTTG